MGMMDFDILDLGLRIECASDARLAHWLLEQAGADRVRLAALALRARRAPSPRRVAEALGLSDEMAGGTVPLPVRGAAGAGLQARCGG